MADSDNNEAKTFPVDSRFQQLARRPGGIPRAEAIERAQSKVDEIKVTFSDWFDQQVQAIVDVLPKTDDARIVNWVDIAHFHCRQLRDVGTTMGFQLVTFIAGNFCEVLDAIKAGAEPNKDLINLHVEALRMSKQDRYQRMTPADFPELSSGLNRLVALAKTGADPQQDN